MLVCAENNAVLAAAKVHLAYPKWQFTNLEADASHPPLEPHPLTCDRVEWSEHADDFDSSLLGWGCSNANIHLVVWIIHPGGREYVVPELLKKD